jgi:Type II secretory pathway, ATPase PulE/Tfp pilus assembly pathway, ATPase PilB
MARRLVKRSIESLLLESGKVTPADLKMAFDRQADTGKKLEEILVEENIISEKELLQIMELYLGIRHVELEKVAIDQEVARSIPEALANKYNLIPIALDNNKVVVAMYNPLNLFAIDDVKFATGYDVEPVIATKEDIKKAIDKLFTKQNAEKAVEDLKNEFDIPVEKEPEDDYIDEVNNAPAVRLVNSIITQAVKTRASDIHIEPFENFIKIRFRIDGQLQEIMRAAKQTASAIVTRIKIMSNLNIAERRVPQDGRIMITVDNKDVDLRISILPTVFGEKVVMRLLNRSNFLVSKEDLGLAQDDMVKLDNVIGKPYGIVLITGPTGSGKSTTLYTLLNDLNTVDKNIITVEDPVEYMMEGINQVHVNTKVGLTFASGLRSILRQDPDIVMIGEIRDGETAEIAIRAAITGHLVLSTLHTNDAPSSITRLVDMGIQPFLVSSSLLGSVAQRLVRKVCTNCMYEYEASINEKQILGINPDKKVVLKKGRGCNMCNHTGYHSRIAIFEIMEMTKDHRLALARNASGDELRDISLKNGMKTLKQSCVELVLKGTTTVDELVRTTFIKD